MLAIDKILKKSYIKSMETDKSVMKSLNNETIFASGRLNLWNCRFFASLTKEQNDALLLEYKQTQDKAKRQKIRDQIVYGNMPLAIDFFNSQYFTSDDQTRDDLLQEAAFAIIRAADLFDLDKNVSFSTYLKKAFFNILSRQIHLDQKKKNAFGLKEKKSPKSDDEDINLEEILEEQYFDNSWVLAKVEVDNLFERVLPRFSEIEQNIFKDVFIKGQMQVDIAKKYNVSKQYISKVLKTMLSDIRKIYEKGGDRNSRKNRTGMLYYDQQPKKSTSSRNKKTNAKDANNIEKSK